MKVANTLTPETSAGKIKTLANDSDEFVTARELCSMLKVGRGKLRRLTQTGILPFIQPAHTRTVIFHVPSIREALIRQQRRGGE